MKSNFTIELEHDKVKHLVDYLNALPPEAMVHFARIEIESMNGSVPQCETPPDDEIPFIPF